VSPENAVAQSAATDTHATFLPLTFVFGAVAFCKFTTMFPIVAFADPVFLAVTNPLTLMKLSCHLLHLSLR